MSHKLVSLYIGEGEYYTRTDADNVIANLKAKLVEQITLRVWAELQLRHQKYKRCLDKAEYCEERDCYLSTLDYFGMTDREYRQVALGYWNKWHKRWLELAEQFKEA